MVHSVANSKGKRAMTNKKFLSLLFGVCTLAMILLSLIASSAFAATKLITGVSPTTVTYCNSGKVPRRIAAAGYAPQVQTNKQCQIICTQGSTIPTGYVIVAYLDDPTYKQCLYATWSDPFNVEVVTSGPVQGQMMGVCLLSPIPAGDVITAIVYPPDPPHTVCDYALVITPAKGNSMAICQNSLNMPAIPSGYQQIGSPQNTNTSSCRQLDFHTIIIGKTIR
jgi:hypothetical protein